MEQNRLKSPVFWASLVAQILSVLAFMGVLDKVGITSDQVQNVVGAILQILVIFGLLNNPTNANGF